MSWFMSKIYDCTCIPSEKAGLTEWRSQLLSGLSGAVLEVGAGTGFNLPRYPESISQLVLSEPDKHMVKKLRQKHGNLLREHVEVLFASLDKQLPFAENSFDGVVSMLVLCSVASQEYALSEILRVLRPGGRFVFLEHVAADEQVQKKLNKWQGRLEPIWKRLMDNCHLRRHTGEAIKNAGFEIEWMKREPIPKAPPWVQPCVRGIARKPQS